MKNLILIGAALFATAPAFAQSGPPRQPGAADGTVIQREPNSTGNSSNTAISRGATGADTVTTTSASGGNANKPEQAIPNSSAGGGSG